MTIAQKVNQNIGHLRTLDRPGLTAWAKVNGMDSRAGFSTFKKALLAEGIDYNAMKLDEVAGWAKAREEAAASVTHEVVLITDAKARTDRFAILGADEQPIWYGRFFNNDRDYDGEQSSGELAAAKKAVWLASKIGEAATGKVKLRLIVDAEWLCWANKNLPSDCPPEILAEEESRGGKALELRRAADRLGIALSVEHSDGASNPADA